MEQRVDVYQPSPEVREFIREHMSSEAIRLRVLEDMITLHPYLETERSIISLRCERRRILLRRWARKRFASLQEQWCQFRAK